MATSACRRCFTLRHSFDRAPGRFGEIQVWNVAKKNLAYSVSVTFDTVYGVSWSPDGSGGGTRG